MNMRINKIHLNRFKLLRGDYIYPVVRGIYVSFDSTTLEYKGLVLYYNIDYKKLYKLEEETLNELISLDFVYTD